MVLDWHDLRLHLWPFALPSRTIPISCPSARTPHESRLPLWSSRETASWRRSGRRCSSSRPGLITSFSIPTSFWTMSNSQRNSRHWPGAWPMPRSSMVWYPKNTGVIQTGSISKRQMNQDTRWARPISSMVTAFPIDTCAGKKERTCRVNGLIPSLDLKVASFIVIRWCKTTNTIGVWSLG